MEFTPRVSWGAKFRWRSQRKKFREKYICPRHLRRTLSKGNSTMKILILLTATAVMLGLSSCAEEPVSTTTTTTHETTTVAQPAATQQTTTTRSTGY